MAAAVIRLVQGDNLPVVRLDIVDAQDEPLDLSDAEVRVRLRRRGRRDLLATLVCTKVTNGEDGAVQFYFPDGTLNQPVGAYEGEVEIDFGGLKQTFYDPLRFSLSAQFG